MEAPVRTNADGQERKVGLELEFTGIPLDRTAGIVTKVFGGEVKKVHGFRYKVKDTRFGDFNVELDAHVLKKMAQRNYLEKLGIDAGDSDLTGPLDDMEYRIGKLAQKVVPAEIGMPPVPMSRLGDLEPLREALRKEKASGSEASWMYAFGMHINAEVPDLGVQTLLRYLRAFLLLYDWLLKEHVVDLSRRISPFIDPFPHPFSVKMLNTRYDPVLSQFISDYLEDNATRNRPFDLVPVMALLDEERVLPAVEEEKNQPRPTFHYRLPNSNVDDPDWRFLDEWERWLWIEKLAHNEELIKKMSRLYLQHRRFRLLSAGDEWIERVNELVHEEL